MLHARFQRFLGLLAVAVPLFTAQATSYFWNANGSNDNWDNTVNWTPASFPGTYPQSGSDDALIPYVSGGYDVKLLTKTIDDFTITGSVDFTAQTGTPTLTVDSITISGPTSPAGWATATISGATITAN